MKLNRYLAVFAAVLLVSVSAYAQVTASLGGTVTMDGNPLPGVTVTIASPNMQGTRTTTTDVNGNFNFAAIPPGTYKLTYEMQGMQNVTRNVQIGVGQTGRADAEMRLSAVAEAITVTAAAPAVLETTEIQTNMQQSTINKLPTARTITGVALLAPGTTSTGPRNALVISGATADQNLIMVDGAVIQENLRGQTHNLFIEDAVQETTVLTGGISAEYGRFTGGVVNSITKSGGNEFHGSYRDNIDNPAWLQPSAFVSFAGVADKRDARVWSQVHEATLGGRIIRDRLWFFTAGRLTKSTTTSAFQQAGGPYGSFPIDTNAHRIEGKLTGQITPKFSIVGTYLDSPLEATNNCQLGCLDPSTFDPSIEQGNDFQTVHANAILTNNWLLEGLYSRKTFTFIGFGGTNTDPVQGSPFAVWNLAGTARLGFTNAPYFCGVCGDETRNNNAWNIKSTYFLSTRNLGSHNLVAGYEKWAENRFSNNYQSPTNFVLNAYALTGTVARASDGTPLVDIMGSGNKTSWFYYYPILSPSLGSDLKTDSIFVNDKWDFNTHLSFQLGARYDKNNAVDSMRQVTSNDANFSPRLGVNYDVFGNGRVRLTAGYNKYVGRLAEGVSGAGSPAGSPATFVYEYRGPNHLGVTPRVAAQRMFEWFNSVGGINNNDLLIGVNIPGFQTKLEGTLDSPNVREYTVGTGLQFGRGYLRADYIDRDWQDFYVTRTLRSYGTVTQPTSGAVANLSFVGNSNDLDRTYRAIQTQGQYRLFNAFQLGGNYTWSRLEGNAVQENIGSGPISEGGWIFQYPEYQGFQQNNPIGLLPADQTHKLRLWASYDLRTFLGNFNVSAIQRYDSGQTYSAVGSFDVRPFVTNPGYATSGVPTAVSYYFSERGEFRLDPLIATDLAATYSFPIRNFELYVEGYVFNMFNNQNVTNVTFGTSTVINTGVGVLKPFNPFTTTEVIGCPMGKTQAECVAMGAHYWFPLSTYGTNHPKAGQTFVPFGQPTSENAYQAPRSYSMAVGLRF